MPVAVVANHLRVDRIHLVAGDQQRPNQQTPVGLDPHRHLPRLLGMGGDQPVQLPDPGQPIANPVGGEPPSAHPLVAPPQPRTRGSAAY
jgi:hypothetical protein